MARRRYVTQKLSDDCGGAALLNTLTYVNPVLAEGVNYLKLCVQLNIHREGGVYVTTFMNALKNYGVKYKKVRRISLATLKRSLVYNTAVVLFGHYENDKELGHVTLTTKYDEKKDRFRCLNYEGSHRWVSGDEMMGFLKRKNELWPVGLVVARMA